MMFRLSAFFRRLAPLFLALAVLTAGIEAGAPAPAYAQTQEAAQEQSFWSKALGWGKDALDFVADYTWNPTINATRNLRNWVFEAVTGIPTATPGRGGDKNLDQWYQETIGQGCFFCSFVGRYIEIGDRFAKESFVTLSKPVGRLLSYVFAFWIIMQGAYLMLAVGPGSNPYGLVWEIAKKSALFFVISAVLIGGRYELYWDAIYQFPLRIAIELSSEVKDSVSIFTQAADGRTIPVPPEASCGDYPQLNLSGSKIPPIDGTLVRAVTCELHKVEFLNLAGFMMGWYSTMNASFAWGDIGNSIMQMLGGIFLMVVFGIAILYFAFFIMDIFTRLVILSSLGPFFIAFMFLNATRGMAISFFRSLFGAFFTFIATSAVYGFCAALLAYLPDVFNQSNTSKTTGVKLHDLVDLMVAISNQVSFSPLDTYYWYLVIAALTVVSMTRKIGGMVDGLFGAVGSVTNMADTATTMAKTGAQLAIGGTMLLSGKGLGIAAGAGLKGMGAASGAAFDFVKTRMHAANPWSGGGGGATATPTPAATSGPSIGPTP